MYNITKTLPTKSRERNEDSCGGQRQNGCRYTNDCLDWHSSCQATGHYRRG